MSRIYYTDNFKFATYTGANLTPFQRDTSDNFKKADIAIGTNKVEYGQLDARMEAAEDDIMILRETSDVTVAKVTALQTSVEKNTEDIATLKPEGIDELQERIEAVGTLANTNANLIQALTVRLADDEDNIAQHAVRIGNLEQLLPTLQTALQQIQAAINNLSSDLTEAKSEIVANQGDIAALDEKMSDTDTSISGINTQLTTLGTQMENISENYANLQQRQTDTEAKVINLDGRVKALEDKS